MEDKGRWRGEGSSWKLEGELNHERLWTPRNNLRVLKGRGVGGWGERGGGYWGGHVLDEELSVMQKQ